MQRHQISPRPNWQEHIEKLGFNFHTIDNKSYWDESAYYHFTAAEIDILETATDTLIDLCQQAVERIITEKRYDGFGLCPLAISLIERSYSKRSPSLYGRFDLSYDGTFPPKMLEYNADTPTALLEASVVQWDWLQNIGVAADQFNSIHEKLIDAWTQIIPKNHCIHFTGFLENDEEYGTLCYLADTALQVTRKVKILPLQDISLKPFFFHDIFLDQDHDKIDYLFKLYPWEWMLQDEFSPHLQSSNIQLLEPAWRILLQNKNILVVLWEMFPDCPYLLPAYATPEAMAGKFVRKPKWGREGAQVSCHSSTELTMAVNLMNNADFIYQQWSTLKSFEGNYPTIGSWVINGQAAGIGIREEESLILTDQGRFIPHCFS